MGAQSASGQSSFTTEGTEEHRESQNPHPVANNATRVGHPQRVHGDYVSYIAVRYNM
jgi:hypothetical protein